MTSGAIVPVAADLLNRDTSPLHPIGGLPMIVHAVRVLAAVVDEVVVVGESGSEASVAAVVREHLPPEAAVTIVGARDETYSGAGRSRLLATGAAALELRAGDAVLVHDPDRPLLTVEVVDAVLSALSTGASAVVPVVEVTDTVKRLDRSGSGRVVGTLSRDRLRVVQTPYGFTAETLKRLICEAAKTVDVGGELAAAHELGIPLSTVRGCTEAFAVREPIDLIRAEALLVERHRGPEERHRGPEEGR
ncbi:MAG: 2-C-methyl-D-erythritol 4-phosphate cytidylyltransferase [Acidothermus sp.]|nr:2-C-methyl-D-erythritol 4-phosphate cytidylyltransferase [Acidothermus sp.]MCL6538276.1 2-C-methyl-D-erythritol 4-phosphate cytidylyltransferase [Acidothermus sp.]